MTQRLRGLIRFETELPGKKHPKLRPRTRKTIELKLIARRKRVLPIAVDPLIQRGSGLCLLEEHFGLQSNDPDFPSGSP